MPYGPKTSSHTTSAIKEAASRFMTSKKSTCGENHPSDHSPTFPSRAWGWHSAHRGLGYELNPVRGSMRNRRDPPRLPPSATKHARSWRRYALWSFPQRKTKFTPFRGIRGHLCMPPVLSHGDNHPHRKDRKTIAHHGLIEKRSNFHMKTRSFVLHLIESINLFKWL